MDEEKFLKCIGDNNRRRILNSLEKKEKCVTDIITSTGMEQTLVSFHLKALRNCGLVTTRRDGKKILYKISNPGILKILNSIQNLVVEINDVCDSDECR
jgi:ArsR family transcriptional regulator